MTTGYKFKNVDLGYFLDLSRTGSNYFKESGTNLTPISTDAVGTLTDVEKINVGFGYKINDIDIKGNSKAKSQLFETPDTYVLNAATYGNVKFRALLVGGGGGGGGGGSNFETRTDGRGGNGGGPGGALISNYMTMNEGLSLTVGAGGSGGLPGGDNNVFPAQGGVPIVSGSNTGNKGIDGGLTKIASNVDYVIAGGGLGGGGGGTANSNLIGSAGDCSGTYLLYSKSGFNGSRSNSLDGGVGFAAGDELLKSSYSTTFPRFYSYGALGGVGNDGMNKPAPSGNYGGGGRRWRRI